MAEHAKLMSPSSAARRIACAGSYVLESLLPDKSGKAADEGTAMHSVAAMCLTSDGRDARAFVGRYIDVHDKGEPVERIAFTPEMAELVQPYINAIRIAAAGADEVLIEQRVDFSRHLDTPEQFGTADAIVVKGTTLEVHDFKSGYHRVEVVRNPQLMLYALGALDRVQMLYEIERVEMVIHQPKVFDQPQSWSCSVDELLVFGEAARMATKRCEAAQWAYNGPARDNANASFADTYLTPGEDQCRFCRAASTCPALRGVVARVVTFHPATNQAALEDFEVLDPAAPVDFTPAEGVTMATADLPHTTPEQLGRLLMMAPLIELWLKAVRAEGDRRLLTGQVVPGFKIVQGKRGARRWSDAEAAEQQLKAMRLKVEEMFDLSLISPTAAERLTKAQDGEKPVIGPRQWAKLKTLIAQPDGKPSVVPVSDGRKALTLAPPADDFEVLQGVEALV